MKELTSFKFIVEKQHRQPTEGAVRWACVPGNPMLAHLLLALVEGQRVPLIRRRALLWIGLVVMWYRALEAPEPGTYL